MNITLLHKCTINDHHICGSWNMQQNRQNFLSILVIFALLPPNNLEINETNFSRYYHFTRVYHEWQSYDVWFLRYDVQQTELFVILGHFLSFYPNKNLENQILKKWKKSEDIVLLHKCNINHDHMLYCSWDTVCDRRNFHFSFWALFLIFYTTTAHKIKIKKMRKKRPGDIIILHMCAKNYDHMMYGSSDMVRNRWTDGQIDGQTDR